MQLSLSMCPGICIKKDGAGLPAPPLGLLQPTDRQVALRQCARLPIALSVYLNVGVQRWKR